MGFTHLHLHTEYSLLDGACRLGPLVDAVKAQGGDAVAITDHGVMYGAVDFYKAAKAKGIKPILGCEVYVAPRTRFDREHGVDSELMHLVLLCENNVGYQNLIKLVSRSFTEGFYFRPRVDRELLEQYHEGLIALSACLAGEIPRLLRRGEFDAARSAALWYDGVFGRGNFYLELQNHGLAEEEQILPQIKALARQTGIPLAATNDTHYIEKADSRMQKVLLCIQTNHTVEDEDGLAFETEEFYLKTVDEMAALFGDTPEALENTEKIAARCNVELEFGHTRLPLFEIGDRDHYEYFREMCYAGLRERYGEHPSPEAVERLEYELGVIRQMGYIDYFLIVQDFVAFAKKNGIPVGPGRGSGAGSLAAYCIGITGVDPLRHRLIFERFLNPERVTMPDFDIDFCFQRRQEVIDYVVRKYGADHVAQIVTFGTLAARAAIRDVARALAIPYAAADKIARLVPREPKITLERAFDESPELKELYRTDPTVRELLDMARKVEGMPRHASTHAAGVVITRGQVDDYVPLSKNDDAVVTQYTMTALEELGLLKMDFLGLRNLTVIHDAERMIRQKAPSFCADRIPLDDPAVYRMFAAGRTEGVFQFESPGMRRLLISLVPDRLDDLIAAGALHRPGPMASIPKYIEGRRHPERITYLVPQLEPVLADTYGCLLYQEQVMQICRELAGYSYGQADIVRRAMSKKKPEVMERERQAFLYGARDAQGNVSCEGAVARGVPEQAANQIFDEIAAFAEYAFNKSHATAYVYVSYQTAYLKCHYPREYMAALLTSVLDYPAKIPAYIEECGRLGIRVMPPHVNESQKDFAVHEGVIRFGLLAIKNFGEGLADRLIAEREEHGPFTGFFDFCRRMYGRELNRRALESLIKSGALDGLGANRAQMLATVGSALELLEERGRRAIDGQLGLFDAPEDSPDGGFALPALAELSRRELLAMERDTTGLYLSGHPMEAYAGRAEELGAARTADLSAAAEEDGEYHDGQRVRLLVQIVSVRTKATRSEQTMAALRVEDRYGAIGVLVFPKTLARYAQLLRPDGVVVLEGRLSVREEREPEVICESVCTPEQAQPLPGRADQSPADRSAVSESAAGKSAAKSGLYLRVPSTESEEYRRAAAVLAVFDGSTPVYLICTQTGKRLLAPRRMWVEPNPPMLAELRRILGAENVAMVYDSQKDKS